MAWNGSDQNASSPGRATSTKSPHPAQGTRHKARGTKHGLLALVIIAALGGVAVWYFTRPAPPPPPAQGTRHNAQIATVTPAPARTNRVAKVDPAEAMRKRYPKLKIPDGWNKPYPPDAYRADGSLKRHSRYVTVVTNHTPKSLLSLEERLFDNTAERDIAIELNTEPGDTFVGDYRYGKKFVRDFLESLEHPVKIEKTDSEEEKALKLAVLETKKELKARYDAGEDIVAIMNETHQQYRELGLYREEVKAMVRDVMAKSEGSLTEQDRVDLIRAANEMLEQRGVKPLKLPYSYVEKQIGDVRVDESRENEAKQKTKEKQK